MTTLDIRKWPSSLVPGDTENRWIYKRTDGNMDGPMTSFNMDCRNTALNIGINYES